jgi:hypothetical protein
MVSRFISAVEGFAGCARGEDQLSDPFGLIRQREMNYLGRSHAKAGDEAGFFIIQRIDRDGGIRQSQGLREGFDDRLQSRIGRKHRFKALAEVGEHGRWIITIPIHQAVDTALQPPAHRLEEHGDHSRREERNHEVDAALLEVIREEPHDQDVEQHGTGGKYAVHQGAIDDRVDLPQLVRRTAMEWRWGITG